MLSNSLQSYRDHYEKLDHDGKQSFLLAVLEQQKGRDNSFVSLRSLLRSPVVTIRVERLDEIFEILLKIVSNLDAHNQAAVAKQHDRMVAKIHEIEEEERKEAEDADTELDAQLENL